MISRGEQDRGGDRRRSLGGQQPEAAAQVEVTLREAPGLAAGLGGNRGGGDAVAAPVIRVPAPVPYLLLNVRLTTLPAVGGARDVGQALIGERPIDQGEGGSFGQRVVLQRGQETGGDRAGGERAAVGMAARQRFQQLAFPGRHRRGLPEAHPGEQAQPGRVREQFDDRKVAE